MQPICPRCNINPTSMTVQVSEDSWQDVCATCGATAETDGSVVIPIEQPTDGGGAS